MSEKSVTTDEMVYVTAGYYHLKTGEFDFNNTNPPFAKIISALPLLVIKPDLPAISGSPETWSEVEQWQYAREFLFKNAIDADSILFLARLPTVGLGLLLGLYVYLFAFRMYGRRSALVALVFFAFCPNLLAHARLATQDLALATFGFIAAYYLWRLLQDPGWPNLLKSALFYALAVITKTSAIFLAAPVVVAAIVIAISGKTLLSESWSIGVFRRMQGSRLRESSHLLVAFLVFGLLSLTAVNLIYGFKGSFTPVGEYGSVNSLAAMMSSRLPFMVPAVDAAMSLPLLVPEPLIRLLEFQSSRVAGGNSIYFFGNLSREGWWYVMPAAFLIKTPIALLAMVGAAAAMSIRSGAVKAGEWILVLLVLYVLGLFAYLKSVSVGLRYILIVYPCLHVIAGGIVRDGVHLGRRKMLVVTMLIAWVVLGTVRAYPDYLPYFNEFIGGPKNGHKYLADSFVDWGQDLPALKAYMDEKGIDRIRLAYFGSGDANHYGINYDYLPSVGLAPTKEGQSWWYEKGAATLPDLELTGGPIAISVTLLAGVFYPGYYAPLRDMEPVDNVGHSILIYEPIETKSN
ncbi:MAG: glycosyltransferase family 39 protein [Gammaproteobacteria bacterium]|nr:glycosyltransferase family 39 protein [Gammaproteobacteria bacterium]